MKICEHDLDIKIRRAREFLENGDKVLVNMLMRGREIVHKDLAQDILDGLAQKLEDVARVEQMPRTEGRRMTMVLVGRK